MEGRDKFAAYPPKLRVQPYGPTSYIAHFSVAGQLASTIPSLRVAAATSNVVDPIDPVDDE